MIVLCVDEICKATNGTLKKGYQTAEKCASFCIDSVTTDTRTLKKNDLFIALKGPSFDAHELLQDAVLKGAAALLVEKDKNIIVPDTCIVIEVKDTRIALGALASYIKQKIEGLKCAAITGSNGKTTCKELLSAILRVHTGSSDSVLATAGNFNNDIGLPLTLLRLEEQHQFAVVELGANHIGEIAYTSEIAKPDVALVNNVMPAHLEGFGSLEGVATAKSEIWSNLAPSGIAVVNLDANFANDFVSNLQRKGQPFLGFSKELSNSTTVAPDLFATEIHFNELGQANFILNVKQSNIIKTIPISLNMPGKHNISNALAASSMAFALGCSLESVQQGLNQVQQVAGRVNSLKITESLTVIDDTYNANSASVNAAIDLLAQYQGKRLLILGDMGELGKYARQEHQSIGQYAQKQGIERLFTVGSLSQFATNAYNAASEKTLAVHFSEKEKLKVAIKDYLSNEQSKVVVLIKGSRSAKMEEIVTFIKTEFSA
jgi:UDP-N-acetylmuramoyl-tripeptide--D-alanyl-D-alanine ligase